MDTNCDTEIGMQLVISQRGIKVNVEITSNATKIARFCVFCQLPWHVQILRMWKIAKCFFAVPGLRYVE